MSQCYDNLAWDTTTTGFKPLPSSSTTRATANLFVNDHSGKLVPAKCNLIDTRN